MTLAGREGIFLCAAFIMVSGEASAQSTATSVPLDLTWSAPAECPDGERVRARVAELVGPHARRDAPLVARGIVSRSTSSYRLELRAEGSAPRSVTHEDCAKLGEAAALILALDIDPNALAPAPAPPAPTEPAPPPALPTIAATKPAPKPRVTPRPAPSARPWETAFGAHEMVDTGSLPRTTSGLALVASVAKGPFAVDLRAFDLRRQLTNNGPRPGVSGAQVALAAASLHACLRAELPVPRYPLELRGCAGGELGRESVRGVNIAQPGTSASVAGAATTMLTLGGHIGPGGHIVPRVGFMVGRPLGAPDVSIEGVGIVFPAPAIFLRGFVGLELLLESSTLFF